MPPRLAMTVGIAVATTVDSIAARNTAPMTPVRTRPRRGVPPPGPGHGFGEPLRRRVLERRIVEPQSVEGIDARVVVRPGDANCVAADQMNVRRLLRVRLSQDRQDLLDRHVPPPALVIPRRCPARR